MGRIKVCFLICFGLAMPLVLNGCGVAARAPQGVAAGDATTAAALQSRGRDLFGAHCARCHGADATGTANAPNLVSRVKGMSEANFSSAVLQRYSWRVPAGEGSGGETMRESMIRGVLTRRTDSTSMPAWESQADVNSGVKSLYAYLSGR